LNIALIHQCHAESQLSQKCDSFRRKQFAILTERDGDSYHFSVFLLCVRIVFAKTRAFMAQYGPCIAAFFFSSLRAMPGIMQAWTT
jgi:hypothetical protein